MSKDNIFTIRSVSQITGIKPYVIRTWERRYGAIDPQRTPTNRRIYAKSDIEKLTLLKQAVERGHSISQIAAMSRSELSELLASTPAQAMSPAGVANGAYRLESPESYRQQSLLAAADLDPKRLEQILADAVVNLSRSDFIHRVVVPLLHMVGDRWSSGKLRVSAEHMTTAVIRSFLWDMIRGVELSENAPKIVLATPVGQWHELGLMVVAAEAGECGWQPIYLGANLPAEEIAYAVEHTGARALALFIAHSLDVGRLSQELKNLHRYLKTDAHLFAGGKGCEPLKAVLDEIGAQHIENIGQFRAKLQLLTDAQQGS
jgi:DNA-binding transcriptional MerR regulator/methylmalonyl-CoA mutase cobalamin-binding subunit